MGVPARFTPGSLVALCALLLTTLASTAAARERSAAPTIRVQRAEVRTDDGGGSTDDLLILLRMAAAGAAGAGAAGAMIAAWRRLRPPVARLALRRVGWPRAAAFTPHRPAAAAAPPDSGRPWTAEVAWEQAGDMACFRVRARPIGGGAGAIVGSSATLSWPPTAAPVRELGDALDALTTSMLAAGWVPAGTGVHWYAQRFVWDGSGLPLRLGARGEG